jgi:hypothetical protein
MLALISRFVLICETRKHAAVAGDLESPNTLGALERARRVLGAEWPAHAAHEL